MAAPTRTPLCLPPDLPYPITLLSLTAPSTPIQRGDVLLTYSYIYQPSSRSSFNGASPEKRSGRWLSALSGTLLPGKAAWSIKAGEVVTRPREVGMIEEECGHPEVFAGMCTACFQDVTETRTFMDAGQAADPSSRPDGQRVNGGARESVAISHTTPLLKVSASEAARLHDSHTTALHTARKLTLIVDLDQTVVHATVDPTVGDWLADLDPSIPPSSRRLKGASARANLASVGRFTLDEPRLPTTPTPACWYYLKPRPDLQAFLERMEEQYEMHVYTMGTRAYANEVCKLIDPDARFFGDRILSRDESGSLTQKSIERLFPVGNSMVVIIDDRSDVWSEARNLIKVVPYEFFVGTGDINGAFLPKQPQQPMTAASAQALTSTEADLPPSTSESAETAASASTAVTAPPGASSAALPQSAINASPASLPSTPSGVDAQGLQQEVDHARELEDVREERPLQAAIDRAISAGTQSSAPSSEKPLSTETGVAMNGKASADGERPAKSPSSGEDASSQVGTEAGDDSPDWEWLFEDTDTELERVEKLLVEIHKRYYFAYSAPKNVRRPTKPPDVKEIIDRLKAKVLTGVNVAFSGVIPLNVRPETFDWWKLATAFGARCSHRIDSSVTHLIASKPGTQKVHEASSPAHRDRIAIVQPGWLLQSCALWERQAEEPFMLELEPSTTPPSAPAPPTTALAEAVDDSKEQDETEKLGELKEELVKEIDWSQIDRELDEFLESDSEGGSEFSLVPDAKDEIDGGRVDITADDEPAAVEPQGDHKSAEAETSGDLQMQPSTSGTTSLVGISHPLLQAARKKRPRQPSAVPSEPDSLFDGSTPATPLTFTEPPTREPSPKRSRLGPNVSRTPSPIKSAMALPGGATLSPKRIPRTVSFDDSASVRSDLSSQDGAEAGISDEDDDDDDDELEDWAKEFEGSMQSAGNGG